MRYRILVRIKMVDKKNAEIIYKSISPDFLHSDIRDVKIKFNLENDMVVAEFLSDDLSHLRGAINTFFRLVHTVSNLIT